MNEDDIDSYVDALFLQSGNGKPTDGDIAFIDFQHEVALRSDRIDRIIEEAYNEVIKWHNDDIKKDADPESGLIGLPKQGPLTQDERNHMLSGWLDFTVEEVIQKVNGGPKVGSRVRVEPYIQVGGRWIPGGSITLKEIVKEDKNLSCVEGLLIVAVGIVAVLIMMVLSR